MEKFLLIFQIAGSSLSGPGIEVFDTKEECETVLEIVIEELNVDSGSWLSKELAKCVPYRVGR